MKKIVYTLVLMLLLSTKVNAQLTPEGVMATLPDMPTAAQMITIETSEQEHDLYVDFHAKLNDAQQKCQEMMDKTTASLAFDVKSQALKEKVPGTNVSVAQAQNMSKSELQALAKSSAQGQMASMGISMADLQAVQSGKMTEDELANKMLAKRTGGLTMKDLEAMSNMSDAEKIEFMQNSGLAASTQAATARNSKASAGNAALTSVVQKITSLQKRIAELTQKSIRLREEGNAFGEDLYAKEYKEKIDALQEEFRALSVFVGGGENGTSAEEAKAREASIQIAAINEQIDGFRHDFYSKSIPVWRNAVIASMDVYRTEILPLQYELKEAYDKAYELTGSHEYMGGDQFPFSAAFGYLESAGYIDNYNF